MNKLVVGNLVHRPLRSLISALAIAIEVIMKDVFQSIGIDYKTYVTTLNTTGVKVKSEN